MSDNDLNTGLTGNMQDFFSDDEDGDKDAPAMGRVAFKVLDFIVYALALYSGYHGINATKAYRAAAGLGNAAGIVGIVIIEATLIAIYEAFKARLIIGQGQKFIAGITFAIGTVLACLGIVGDSQMQAGIEITSWLRTYMVWGLPLAPVVMALGAAGIVITHPVLLRQIAAALKRNTAAEKKHTAQMKAQDARLTVAQSAANLQLNTLAMTAQYAHAAYRSPQVQRAIQEAALANLPELLRGAGVMLPYGTVIEGQTIAPLPPLPVDAPQEEPTAETSWLDRLRGRQPAPQPTQAQPTQPQPAAVDEAALTAALTAAVIAALGKSTRDDAPRHPAPVVEAMPSANGHGEGRARPQSGPPGE